MSFWDKMRELLGESAPASAPKKIEVDTTPFQPSADHPLAREHAMFAEFAEKPHLSVSYDTLEPFQALPQPEASRVAEAVIESMRDQVVKIAAAREKGADYKVVEPLSNRSYRLRTLLKSGLWHGLPVRDPALLQWLEWSVAVYQLIESYEIKPLIEMAEMFEGAVSRVGNEQPYLGQLQQLCRRFLGSPSMRREHWAWLRVFRDRLGMTPEIHIGDKRRWSKRVNKDFEEMPPAKRLAWVKLFDHFEDSSAAEPSEKWLAGAKELVASPELGNWEAQMGAWLTDFCLPRGEEQSEVGEENSAVLKGIGWVCTLAKSPELSRLIPKCAVAAYQDVSNVAIYASAVGNGFINALGLRADAASLEQLALLRTRIKRPQAQKCLEKALKLAARETGSTPQQVAEANVPEYGMTEVGVLQKQLGDFNARLTAANAQSIEIEWTDAAGKVLRSAPKAAELAADIKALKAAAKDIQKMLAAQVARLEAIFLEQRQWEIGAWRRYYLDHRLVGILARRLIWNVATGGETRAALWHDGQLVGVDGKAIATNESTTVTLWHPLNVAAEEVLAWRNCLEAFGCTQPFKQAYREVYLLTPAEERTNVYSNRFAGHILKQHQFHALALGRGWKHAFRMPFADGGSDAKRDLPGWKLRAEFWVGGAGEETSDSGMFLYLSTDQVRFQRLHGRKVDPEPLPLSEIPPVVFSEVMRDVDLFVGVASVGNDPTWRDTGALPNGREYWNAFAFGDLSATARTRREVLQKLVPRLKIAAQCSFEDKYLVVRGKLRTYKIHLGSGNILMSPNDQYLCIVASRAMPGNSTVFLPFEGDSILSLVISKALLLAADDKIKDPTITQQIGS